MLFFYPYFCVFLFEKKSYIAVLKPITYLHMDQLPSITLAEKIELSKLLVKNLYPLGVTIVSGEGYLPLPSFVNWMLFVANSTSSDANTPK